MSDPLKYKITVELTYPAVGESHSDCRIFCEPDGGTPVIVAIDASALLGGYARFVGEQAGLNRDVTLSLLLQRMAAAGTSATKIEEDVVMESGPGKGA